MGGVDAPESVAGDAGVRLHEELQAARHRTDGSACATAPSARAKRPSHRSRPRSRRKPRASSGLHHVSSPARRP